MDKFRRLKEIIETYEKKMEEEGIKFEETPSRLFSEQKKWRHALGFLEYSTRHGIIQPPGPIAYTGSGYGIESAFFDVYGFSPIINIEHDPKLVKDSGEIIDDLVQRGIVSGNIRIVHGDFRNSEAYRRAKVPFINIPYFFTGVNGEPLIGLAEKIRRESPKKTKLIVYRKGQEPEVPLKLEYRLGSPFADFLVYRK